MEGTKLDPWPEGADIRAVLDAMLSTTERLEIELHRSAADGHEVFGVGMGDRWAGGMLKIFPLSRVQLIKLLDAIASHIRTSVVQPSCAPPLSGLQTDIRAALDRMLADSFSRFAIDMRRNAAGRREIFFERDRLIADVTRVTAQRDGAFREIARLEALVARQQATVPPDPDLRTRCAERNVLRSEVLDLVRRWRENAETLREEETLAALDGHGVSMAEVWETAATELGRLDRPIEQATTIARLATSVVQVFNDGMSSDSRDLSQPMEALEQALGSFLLRPDNS